MAFRTIVALAAAIMLAGSATASAQRWGRGRTPRDGACFYRDVNFGGEYFCVDAGSSLASLPSDMNDAISSMRIFGRAEVTVYRDRRYNGPSSRFERDVRNMRREGWNDSISSIEVRSARGGGFGGFGGGYGGGQDPDRIVRRAYQDILEREPDAAGLRLYRSRIIDDGWTEKQVRDALRESPEYRKLGVTKAQDIVRRAYLNVLKREPDAGASSYVDKVLRQHWSQADVERALRKSPEYRGGGR